MPDASTPELPAPDPAAPAAVPLTDYERGLRAGQVIATRGIVARLEYAAQIMDSPEELKGLFPDAPVEYVEAFSKALTALFKSEVGVIEQVRHGLHVPKVSRKSVKDAAAKSWVIDKDAGR